jgi:hypothetical protein
MFICLTLMSHPVHLILSPGKRIVMRNDANRIGGQAAPAPNSVSALISAGAVGKVIQSPADAKHAYKVCINDGPEAMVRRTEFSILKECKAVPDARPLPPGSLSPQRHQRGEGQGWFNPASQSKCGEFESWKPFIIYRCVVGSQAFGFVR